MDRRRRMTCLALQNPPPREAASLIVLRLNDKFFRQTFLPQLAARNFPVNGEARYDVLIVESRSENCRLQFGAESQRRSVRRNRRCPAFI